MKIGQGRWVQYPSDRDMAYDFKITGLNPDDMFYLRGYILPGTGLGNYNMVSKNTFYSIGMTHWWFTTEEDRDEFKQHFQKLTDSILKAITRRKDLFMETSRDTNWLQFPTLDALRNYIDQERDFNFSDLYHVRMPLPGLYQDQIARYDDGPMFYSVGLSDWYCTSRDTLRGLREKFDWRSMDFSTILVHVKDGLVATRQNWPDEEFVFMVQGSQFQVNRAPLNQIFPEGTVIDYQPHLDKRLSNGQIMTWTPSQEDLFAEDWIPAITQVGS